VAQFYFNAACSTGTITTYTWDFGDGTTAATASYHKTYLDSGPWTVVLTVAGPTGTSVISGVVTAQHSGSTSAMPVSSAPQVGDDPQVMLRMSNDGGKTWPIPEQWRSAGKMGEYWRRIRWNGLGCARRRVFEVSVTDPVPWRLVGAILEPSQTKPAASAGEQG
jgi:hypothetical protein